MTIQAFKANGNSEIFNYLYHGDTNQILLYKESLTGGQILGVKQVEPLSTKDVPSLSLEITGNMIRAYRNGTLDFQIIDTGLKDVTGFRVRFIFGDNHYTHTVLTFSQAERDSHRRLKNSISRLVVEQKSISEFLPPVIDPETNHEYASFLGFNTVQYSLEILRL